MFAIAAVHSLNDLLLFLAATGGNTAESYVAGEDNVITYIVVYVIFSLILVPNLVRGIRNIKPEEAIPFDEDFLPRKVEYEKKAKKKYSNFAYEKGLL